MFCKNSPRARATKYVINNSNLKNFRTQSHEFSSVERKKLVNSGSKDIVGGVFKEFANQTFVHSLKAREIIKNGYQMPMIKNKAFIPPN